MLQGFEPKIFTGSRHRLYLGKIVGHGAYGQVCWQDNRLYVGKIVGHGAYGQVCVAPPLLVAIDVPTSPPLPSVAMYEPLSLYMHVYTYIYAPLSLAPQRRNPKRKLKRMQVLKVLEALALNPKP